MLLDGPVDEVTDKVTVRPPTTDEKPHLIPPDPSDMRKTNSFEPTEENPINDTMTREPVSHMGCLPVIPK